MVKAKSRSEVQLFVPEIFIQSLNKGNKLIDSVTLEAIIKLQKTMNKSVKEILIAHAVILATIAYAAQAKLCAKLIIPRKPDSSAEKVFQQTETHSKFVKILSNSTSAKLLLAMQAIMKGLNKGHYGLTDEESTEEGFLETVNEEIDALSLEKGAGNTKVMVRDPESRLSWARGICASLRSKWCSIPTYSPNKTASTNASIKNLNRNDFFNFLDRLHKKLVEEGIISNDDIPSSKEIEEKIQEEIQNLRIDRNICDDMHGIFAPINLEVIFAFNRTTTPDLQKKKKELPEIAKKLLKFN